VTALLVAQGAWFEQGVAAAVLTRFVTLVVSLLGGVRCDLLDAAIAPSRE